MSSEPRQDFTAKAIEAIYATAVNPELWPCALQAIADCSADIGAVMLYQRDDGSLGTIISPHLSLEAQENYHREWWRHDIRSFRALERGLLIGIDAITDRHVVSQEEVETHPIYTEFLVPNGLGWFAAVGLSPGPGRLVWISVQRSMSKPPFTDSDLDVLSMLGRHAENALRLGIRLLDAELASETFSALLSQVRVGVFLLDHAERLIFANPAAEQLIGDKFSVVDHRLQPRLRSDREALVEAIENVRRMPLGVRQLVHQPVVLHGNDDQFVAAAYVLPVIRHAAGPMDQFLSNAHFCIVTTTSKGGGIPDPSLVRDILGITLSEARIASLIAAGSRTSEAAKTLGITEGTARTALKRVFGKTGVSRQSELAALLSRLLLN
jgi:DNA-binding CsgD family transcriptional regulator